MFMASKGLVRGEGSASEQNPTKRVDFWFVSSHFGGASRFLRLWQWSTDRFVRTYHGLAIRSYLYGPKRPSGHAVERRDEIRRNWPKLDFFRPSEGHIMATI